MIRSVAGRLSAVDADGLVVEVGGVGLLVRASAAALGAASTIGAPVRLSTQMVVREDALDLYGFVDDGERRLFDQLIGVSGVGPRMALAILGVDGPDGVRLAIARGDTAKIQRAVGVGRRTAERVVLELRDRVGAGGGDHLAGPSAGVAGAADLEARDALVALGFRAEEAEAAIADAPDGLDAEGLVRHGLGRLRRP